MADDTPLKIMSTDGNEAVRLDVLTATQKLQLFHKLAAGVTSQRVIPRSKWWRVSVHVVGSPTAGVVEAFLYFSPMAVLYSTTFGGLDAQALLPSGAQNVVCQVRSEE